MKTNTKVFLLALSLFAMTAAPSFAWSGRVDARDQVLAYISQIEQGLHPDKGDGETIKKLHKVMIQVISDMGKGSLGDYERLCQKKMKEVDEIVGR